MKNLLQYVGIRHLRMKPARTVLTTLGVAFGIALYVAIAIINESTKNSFRENIEAVSGKAKLRVSTGDTGFPEEKLEEVKAVPGVRAAVPLIESRAFFEGARQGSQSVYVLGVDMLQEGSVRVYKTTDQEIIDDPLVFLNQPDSIVVTRDFAGRHGLTIDSKLRLATAEGVKEFTIRGLLEPEGAAKAYGGSLAIMDIDGARVSFGKVGRTDKIDVVPAEGQDVDELAKRIQAKLGAEFTVERPETQASNTENMIRSYQSMLTFFSSLALLVGLFLVLNSVNIAVAERRKEIGILRALGATRTSIVAIFVGESAFMGLLGALLGCGLGRILANLIVHQVVFSVAAQYRTRIEISEMPLTGEQVAFTLLIGVGTSALAALWPAYRASFVSPLEAMKTHGIEAYAHEKTSSRTVWIGAALLTFMFVSMRLGLNQRWPIFEQLNQGASVLGAAFFGPFLVFYLIRALRKAVSVAGRPVFRLAQDNLLRSRKRTAGNVTALMVGLFLVMLIASVRASFQKTLTDWLNDALAADLIISGSGALAAGDTQPMNEEIETEILKVPGIQPVKPGHGTRIRIVNIASDGVRYTIKAIDRPMPETGYRKIPVSRGDRVEVVEKFYDETEPAILISENYLIKNPDAERAGYVELNTPTGRQRFKVMGFLTEYASNEGTFYLPREVYKKFWRDSYVSSFGLHLEPGADLEEVRRKLDAAVGARYGLTILSNHDLRDVIMNSVDRSFAYTRAVEMAALLVALLGLLNTLLISVMERTREIGMLRAIGTSRGQISNMILSESVIQGGFGALVAVLLGGWTAKIWIENSLAHVLGWQIGFYLPVQSVATTVLVGVLVAWIAGIYPSRRAARLPITEALDYE